MITKEMKERRMKTSIEINRKVWGKEYYERRMMRDCTEVSDLYTSQVCV